MSLKKCIAFLGTNELAHFVFVHFVFAHVVLMRGYWSINA